MKKTILIITSILLVIVIAFTMYWNLPIEITRKSDIQFGNQLIKNIETYQTINKKFPENQDWKTLEKLGFQKEGLETKPYYSTNHQDSYELIYKDEFEGPYLLWNSQEKNGR
ncbi:hypothetical protein [Chryseobacterium polytrichastri]|uniref:Uncharacterized protein n=1 Tax=Chryseobacterium polytrichastri TaxID=1302687 RepID=A0A1M7DA33_9FLAO|nr:hypothetical protein [Chryseobacterium polytrichastri]SHL76334.1 hypothetical protein SAMN05444267_102445 [Chryseobacterium polytrichastri]